MNKLKSWYRVVQQILWTAFFEGVFWQGPEGLQEDQSYSSKKNLRDYTPEFCMTGWGQGAGMLAKGGRVLRGCGLLVRLGQCTPQLPPVRVPASALLPPVAHLLNGFSSNCTEANLTYQCHICCWKIIWKYFTQPIYINVLMHQNLMNYVCHWTCEFLLKIIVLISRLNEASWAGWRRTCLRINRWVLVTPLLSSSSYPPILLSKWVLVTPLPPTLLLNSQPDHNIINNWYASSACEIDKPGETSK